jgi:hypothetical protein
MGGYVAGLAYIGFDVKLSERQEREVGIIFEEFILVIFSCFYNYVILRTMLNCITCKLISETEAINIIKYFMS